MKFALISKEKERQEAQPNLSGECLSCGRPMVARCGEIRVWHWAHQGRRLCDPWWENETEWHRVWKNQFPTEWQEIVHAAEDGERHIADVKTHDGWALEFQHSNIRPDERRSRETFYQSLIWVVDGMRRARDAAQFSIAWSSGESRNRLSTLRRIPFPKGALLRDWAGSRAHVFFDFGDWSTLWWLFPESGDERAYVYCISRAQFIRIHRERHSIGPSEFDSLVGDFRAFIAQYEQPPLTPSPRHSTGIPADPSRGPMIQRNFRL